MLQLEKADRELLARLSREAPLLPGAEVLAFVDIDSTQKRVYGHQKQGARFGHTKIQGKSLLVNGLNALIAAVSTPLAAPAAATRPRGGNAPSSRSAAGLAAQAIGTARDCGATGTIVVRMDSAYYAAAVIAAVRRNGARSSVTAPVKAAIRAAIAAIPENAWTAIDYPQAVWDDQLGCRVSDAEVAETPYTAFTSKKKARRSPPAHRPPRPRQRESRTGPGRAVPRLALPRRLHRLPVRDHSRPRSSTATTPIVEQVFADLNDGPLAHLPSGRFNANAAWLASPPWPTTCSRRRHPRLPPPRQGPRRHRPPRPDRRRRPHRPPRPGPAHPPPARGWHREREWLNLCEAACGPPAKAA